MERVPNPATLNHSVASYDPHGLYGWPIFVYILNNASSRRTNVGTYATDPRKETSRKEKYRDKKLQNVTRPTRGGGGNRSGYTFFPQPKLIGGLIEEEEENGRRRKKEIQGAEVPENPGTGKF